MTEAELVRRLRSDANGLERALHKGMVPAARKGRALLSKKTPGGMKRSWKVRDKFRDLALVNDFPFAGILELGSKPHQVGPAGRDALRTWVLQKYAEGKMSPKTPGVDLYTWAEQTAGAIATSIERHGTKAYKYVWKSLNDLVDFLDYSVPVALNQFFRRS